MTEQNPEQETDLRGEDQVVAPSELAEPMTDAEPDVTEVGIDRDDLDGEDVPREVAVGHTIQVPENGVVIRPNGDQSTVTGGHYVIDVPGLYLVDGEVVQGK